MKYHHIIDHEGFGTIHKLLGPLCTTYCNHILYTINNYKKIRIIEGEIKNNSPECIIIHSTGKMNSEIIHDLKKYPNDIYKAIFMHTSYEYQLLKKRQEDMRYLLRLQEYDRVAVFVPSIEVANQFEFFGIKAIPIQLGISSIELNSEYLEYDYKLKDYYHRIITTCSSNKPIYQYVKGLDIFEKVMYECNLINRSLIAGIENYNDNRIEAKCFNERDFLNVLAHSKMYVQFSRFETYNLTAVQAKRFRIPVVLLVAEGNRSCMGENVFENKSDAIKGIKKIIAGQFNKEILEICYFDSVSRENLSVFAKSLDRAIIEWYGDCAVYE